MFWKICDLRNFAKLRVSSCAYSLELLYQRLATLLKELPAHQHRCFAVTFAYILRTPFIPKTSVIQKQTIFTATEEQLLCGTAFLRRPSIFIEHCFRRTYRSSHRRWSIKRDVLRKFAKFTGKHLCQSLFY